MGGKRADVDAAGLAHPNNGQDSDQRTRRRGEKIQRKHLGYDEAGDLPVGAVMMTARRVPVMVMRFARGVRITVQGPRDDLAQQLGGAFAPYRDLLLNSPTEANKEMPAEQLKGLVEVSKRWIKTHA